MCISYLFYDNYLLTSNISIDRVFVAPGRGKNVVDGLNTKDKRYLREQMNILLKIYHSLSNPWYE